MRGLLKFCCFSPPQTLDSQEPREFKRLGGSKTIGSKDSCQAVGNPQRTQKAWWCRKRQRKQTPGDRLLGQYANSPDQQNYYIASGCRGVGSMVLQDKAAATSAQAGTTEGASGTIRASYPAEKEPLKVHASSMASQPLAPPAGCKASAGPNVGEGYEVAPFCSEVRWKKDRSLRKLSAGGTGTVYRAEKVTSSCAISLDQPSTSGSPAADFSHVTHVAVKAMNVEQGDNAQLAEHEGQVLASLSGQHYVPIFYGYYTDPESQQWHRRAYVLTELLPGINLDDFCHKVRKATGKLKSPQQVTEVRQWMWNFSMHAMYLLVQALSNVHEQRSHRDLKAGNVMVSGWQSMDGLKIHLIDWANSRRHDEGHLLNEYCTPEYSSPQLIAAITNLPAPVMDDAANDVWSLGVMLFQMLTCTVPGPQVPFEPDYQQLGGLVGAARLRGIQTGVQQQQADWGHCNPAYKAHCSKSESNQVSEAGCSQPWQLLAVQKAANFSNERENGIEQYDRVAELLSGMLHPNVAQRLTATQLATQQWLRVAGSGKLGPCPVVLQKALQK